MGYFDGLTSSSFAKNEAGDTVFYPWGVLGRGRILPGEETAAKVRSFVRLYYQITLPSIIGVGFFFGWTWGSLLLPIFGAWYYFGVRSLVSGCEFADRKLTVKESYFNSAAGHSKSSLWALFTIAVLFVVIGVAVTLNADSQKDFLVGVIIAVFFGAGGVVFGYMLKAKYQK